MEWATDNSNRNNSNERKAPTHLRSPTICRSPLKGPATISSPRALCANAGHSCQEADVKRAMRELVASLKLVAPAFTSLQQMRDEQQSSMGAVTRACIDAQVEVLTKLSDRLTLHETRLER